MKEKSFLEILSNDESAKIVLEGCEENFKKESDLVKGIIIEEMMNVLDQLVYDFSPCESPIEKALAIKLKSAKDYNEQFGYETKLEVQKEIKVNGKNYRADIVLTARNKEGSLINVVVECDGHEFHEKTKEQAAKDKRRDRDFLSIGYNVIRFTGSEIYKDASICAWEVVNIIEDLIKLKN